MYTQWGSTQTSRRGTLVHRASHITSLPRSSWAGLGGGERPAPAEPHHASSVMLHPQILGSLLHMAVPRDACSRARTHLLRSRETRRRARPCCPAVTLGAGRAAGSAGRAGRYGGVTTCVTVLLSARLPGELVGRPPCPEHFPVQVILSTNSFVSCCSRRPKGSSLCTQGLQ